MKKLIDLKALSKDDKKLLTQFNKALDGEKGRYASADLCDAQQFNEFNREQMMMLDINSLFESGKIDFLYRDNIHENVEVVVMVVDGDEKVVLCIPQVTTYAHFREVIDAEFTNE